jgi:hypothetical protein
MQEDGIVMAATFLRRRLVLERLHQVSEKEGAFQVAKTALEGQRKPKPRSRGGATADLHPHDYTSTLSPQTLHEQGRTHVEFVQESHDDRPGRVDSLRCSLVKPCINMDLNVTLASQP